MLCLLLPFYHIQIIINLKAALILPVRIHRKITVFFLSCLHPLLFHVPHISWAGNGYAKKWVYDLVGFLGVCYVFTDINEFHALPHMACRLFDK